MLEPDRAVRKEQPEERRARIRALVDGMEYGRFYLEAEDCGMAIEGIVWARASEDRKSVLIDIDAPTGRFTGRIDVHELLELRPAGDSYER
jgi:hypothetical protein